VVDGGVVPKLKVIVLLLLISLFLFNACETTKVSTPLPYKIITGTVMYPNIVYFPSRLRLEINLMGRNPGTQQTTLFVNQNILNPQRFPLNFILRYDPAEVVRSLDYFITVDLYREGQDSPSLTSGEIHLPSLKESDSVYIELKAIN